MIAADSQGISLLEIVQQFSGQKAWGQQINLLQSESKLVAKAGSISLLRFAPSKIQNNKVNPKANPVLFIPSYINRHYILDLIPEKSLIKYFLESGFPVYLLDWGKPNDEDKYLHFETLFSLHLDYLLAHIKSPSTESSRGKFHIIGQCLGGQIGMLLSLLQPRQVASLSLLTTPIDFNHGGKLTEWARHPDFKLDNFIKARGMAPWPWMQMGFLGMKPLQNFSKYKRLFKNRKNEEFLKSFFALETWSFDNISIRSEFFLTLIKDFYQKNAWLTKEGYPLLGNNLKVSNLNVPVSVLSSADDHIVPAASTLNQNQVPKAVDFKKWDARGGHIGVLLGGSAKANIWPQLRQWIEKHDGP